MWVMTRYVAAALSAIALVLAIFLLPESKHPDSEKAGRKIFDLVRFRQAMSVPSVALVLLAIFVCIFSFANFETTLSLLIYGGDRLPDSPFEFSRRTVCLTFAYIGLTLALVQGGVVRRLAGRIDEGKLAAAGALALAIGFGLTIAATTLGSIVLLFVALTVIVSGFSFMQPNLNALLSRRSDPERQGLVLGVGQSVSALARIVGSAFSIPLLKYQLSAPYWLAAALMLVGMFVVTLASRRGRDFDAES
jgi:predicted MFS family arabinose efflux permease